MAITSQHKVELLPGDPLMLWVGLGRLTRSPLPSAAAVNPEGLPNAKKTTAVYQFPANPSCPPSSAR